MLAIILISILYSHLIQFFFLFIKRLFFSGNSY